MQTAHKSWRTAVMGVALMALTGCYGPPRVKTTFLGSVDLVEMTDRMAESFVADPVIGARSPDDPPWVISIADVRNRTNQILPERERWLFVGRLRALLDRSDVSERASLVWIIPPERWPVVAEELDVSEQPYGLRMDPTHLLTGTFSSLTQTSGAGRSDTYLCAYELVDLIDGRIVWQDSWEVKRAVVGRTYD